VWEAITLFMGRINNLMRWGREISAGAAQLFRLLNRAYKEPLIKFYSCLSIPSGAKQAAEKPLIFG
jgi:hypothetical protein